MADKTKRSSSHKVVELEFEENLADNVKQYPVLYDRALPAFKDKQLRDSVWDEIAKTVGLYSGQQAETAFKRLRDKYTRLKKAIEEIRRGGDPKADVADIENKVESLNFMNWIYPFIHHRHSRSDRSKNYTTIVTQQDVHTDTSVHSISGEVIKLEDTTSDSGDNLPVEVIVHDGTSRNSELTPKSSQVFQRVHEENLNRIISSQTPTPQKFPLRKRSASAISVEDHPNDGNLTADQDKPEVLLAVRARRRCDYSEISTTQIQNEDELFCSFVGSQLRQMSPQQKLVAKYQINNILFQILMRGTTCNVGETEFVTTSLDGCAQANCIQHVPYKKQHTEIQTRATNCTLQDSAFGSTRYCCSNSSKTSHVHTTTQN